MTSLHQNINQEHVQEHVSAVEELHSRWSSTSCSQVIVDRLPSQPISRRQSRRGSACGRLQGSNSKWTSGSGVITDSPPLKPLSRFGSGVITDSPPLKPLSRRRSAVGRLELSGSRWSSGSQAAFDTTSSQALVRQ
jgi:hypothetical protein